jgi:hypothetical protein
LQAGHTLYKLEARILARHSGMFRMAFSMPAGANQQHTEGLTEDLPITLLLGSEPEFDVFVSQAYGS